MLAVSPIPLTIRQSEEQKELVGIPTSSFLDNVKGETDYVIICNSKIILCIVLFYFIILDKKTPSSRSVKGHSPGSRREMNWPRTRDGRKPS